MAKYVPSPRDWVREQVELYESSSGTKGTTLRDTGLPVVIVTHRGRMTGAIRKTPLMRVKEGDNYILVGSQGGAPKDQPDIERVLRSHEAQSGGEWRRLRAYACRRDQGPRRQQHRHSTGGEGEAVQPLLHDQACR